MIFGDRRAGGEVGRKGIREKVGLVRREVRPR